MITGIEGILTAREKQAVILTISGISLRILVPSSVLPSFTEIGTLVHLYTSLHVREDGLSLYGFLTTQDRDTFEVLLNVNGVGSKAALSLLSIFSYDVFWSAIRAKDEHLLAATPGIGKKLTARIVLELQNKIPEDAGTGSELHDVQQRSEVTQALLGLGFAEQNIRAALRTLPQESQSLEEMLSTLLRTLAKQ